jgi:hypothetical protein
MPPDPGKARQLRQRVSQRLCLFFLQHGSGRLQSLLFFLTPRQLPEAKPQKQQLDQHGRKQQDNP